MQDKIQKEKARAKDILVKAYRKIGMPESMDFQDSLNGVTEKLLTDIESGNIDKFCFDSVKNMVMYLKGSIKNRLINISQETENIISYETIEDKRTYQKTDLFKGILEAKSKTQKELFNDNEKGLLHSYYVEAKTYREIGKELNKPFKSIQRQLIKLNNRIASNLPIREVFNLHIAIAEPVNKYSYWPDSDIITPISLLKTHRRNKDKWIKNELTGAFYQDMTYRDKYRTESLKAVKKHKKQNADIIPVTIPEKEYTPVEAMPIDLTDLSPNIGISPKKDRIEIKTKVYWTAPDNRSGCQIGYVKVHARHKTIERNKYEYINKVSLKGPKVQGIKRHNGLNPTPVWAQDETYIPNNHIADKRTKHDSRGNMIEAIQDKVIRLKERKVKQAVKASPKTKRPIKPVTDHSRVILRKAQAIA